MARWSPVNIAGGAYSDDARPWSCQDTVNYIPVPAEREGTRSPMILRGAPGFTTFCATMQEAPVRGLHDVEGLLLAVTGNKLYSIGTDGAASEIGTVPGVRRVTMAHNQIEGGHEVMVANGQSGYVYKTTDGSFAQVTDEGFPGLKTTDFIDGYIAGIEPAGRFWFHSQLLDAASYNTIDRYDAESAPDKMVAMVVSHREVLVLNERSGAFFRNSGGATGTFQNSNGMEMEVGCASTHAAARLDNTVYWLGHDGIVYRLAGHQPQRVSTGPVEQAISRCDAANAFAFTFEDRGHKIFYLTFPDGATWGYDVWTGEWHRRQSKGLDRWRLSSLVRWNGVWIGGDFSNGRLYQLDWAVQHEAGEELMRRRVMPVLHDSANDVIVNALRLIVDTGVDATPSPILPALAISGDLPDGNLGEVVSGSYAASGGVLPYESFSLTNPAAFPAGLTFNPDGTYSGTRTEGGSYEWTVQIEDASGVVASLDDTSETYSDPYWANVISLLHFEGADGSDVFTDEKTPVWSNDPGNAAFLTTTAPLYGEASLLIAAAAQYSGVSCGPPSGITGGLFGDEASDVGDFCVEATVVPTAVTGGTETAKQFTVFSTNNAAAGGDFNVQIYGGQWRVLMTATGATLIAPGGAAVAGQQHHVAFVRDSGVAYLYVDGSLVGQAAYTHSDGNIGFKWGQKSNGNQANGDQGFEGRIDEARITKGTPRYTGPFTPPTRAFPNG